MSYTPILTGRVDAAGRVDPPLREKIRATLERLAGKDVEITIRKQKLMHPRTAKQSAYYWAVVLPTIANHVGYAAEELHEAFKLKFLRKRAQETWGGLPTVRSTASLDTVDFAEYIESIKRFASEELHVVVPEAGEVSINELQP